MPRADEPRVTVRFSKVDYAMLEAAAEAGNVAVGALVREGALKFARELAGGSSLPARRMRRRSPVPAPEVVLPDDRLLSPEEIAENAAVIRRRAGIPVEIPKDGAERTAFFQRLSQRKP